MATKPCDLVEIAWLTLLFLDARHALAERGKLEQKSQISVSDFLGIAAASFTHVNPKGETWVRIAMAIADVAEPASTAHTQHVFIGN